MTSRLIRLGDALSQFFNVLIFNGDSNYSISGDAYRFRRARNYDGILSACTYATSGVQQFAAEGQHAVNVRDATRAALYAIMGEVDAGTRTVPTGYADIEPLLPSMEWPA